MRFIKIGLILLLFALQAKLWFGDTGIFVLWQTQKQAKEYQIKNDKILAENQKIEADIAAIKNDPAAIEAKVRRELGMVRGKEKFFRYSRDTTPESHF